MSGFPYVAADGSTRWACCDSTIGPPCRHRQNPDGTVDCARGCGAELTGEEPDGICWECSPTDARLEGEES